MLYTCDREDAAGYGLGEASVPDCTSLSLVLLYFVNIAYVILRKPGHAPHPTISEPFCTCVCYCRYASCEHVEYAKFRTFRLRAATSTVDALPELKRRGRKRGKTLTQRGAAKAKRQPKTKAKHSSKSPNAISKLQTMNSKLRFKADGAP